MLLFEAKEEIEARLELQEEYKAMIPEYFEALEIAKASIEAQERLADLLESLSIDCESEENKNDSYSIRLVYEMLSSIRHDAKFDEEGMFDEEATNR